MYIPLGDLLSFSQDTECRACKEVVGTNVPGFEECQLYYGFSDDVCVNQASLGWLFGSQTPPPVANTASPHLEIASLSWDEAVGYVNRADATSSVARIEKV